MKVTVNVELAPSEAANAPNVQKAFQELADTVDIKVTTDKSSLGLLIREGSGSQKVDVVLQEVARRLSKPELRKDCMDVILETLSSPTIVGTQIAFNVCGMLARLQDPLRTNVRDAIKKALVEKAAQPVGRDESRASLLPYAETLTAMAKQSIITLKSAILFSTQLLLDDHTRTMGITCLGKIAESHGDVQLDPQAHEMCKNAVSTCTDPAYAYDVDYISDVFGWATSSSYVGSTVISSTRHNRSSILAMCGNVDERPVVVTSSAAGDVVTWDASKGTVMETISLANHFGAALDTFAEGRGLIVAGNGRQSGVTPALIIYTEEGGKWTEKGAVEPPGAKVVSAVRSLKSTNVSFAAGVTSQSNTHSIAIFDMGRGVQATSELRQHNDVITSLYAPRDRDQMLFSGSRDTSVFVYDVRDNQHNVLGHHTDTVTCIASLGDYVVTGSLDRHVILHDLRMAQQPVSTRELDSPITSVYLAQPGNCIASTMTGVHVLDATQSGMPSSRVFGLPSNNYNVLVGHPTSKTFYFAGEGKSLDVAVLDF